MRVSSTSHRSAPTSDPAGAAAFLQQRVGVFGLMATGFGATFLAVRIGLAGPQVLAEVRHPSFHWHVLGVLSVFAVWAVTRLPSLTVPTIQRVEAFGLVVSSFAYAMMGVESPPAIRPDHVVLLALVLGFMARAVYVPSSAGRTAFLGGVIAVPLLYSTFVLYARWEPPPGYPFPKLVLRTATLVEVTAWWLLTTVLGTFTSHVLYGLRQEASAARRLGQYTLEEKIGEGGMGGVYRARHAMLRRPTAVKLLLPDRAGPDGIARFEREVQLTARLTHPHTVTVYDYGRTGDGVFYYAMELLDGATLSEVVAVDGAQPAGRVVAVLDAVAGALAEAHGVGLIHRDIKPANVMLCRQGGLVDFPKVLDFGLVKEVPTDGRASPALTQANALAGTPLYMAPETIVDPRAVDPRSDIYALGAVGYFLLTGDHVFTGRTSVEVCSHHLHTAPEPPSRRLGAAVPGGLEATLLRCLAKEPAERPTTADALRAELARIDGYARWTENDAVAWWREHGAALSDRRRSLAPAEGARTLEIDLQRRVRGRAVSA